MPKRAGFSTWDMPKQPNGCDESNEQMGQNNTGARRSFAKQAKLSKAQEKVREAALVEDRRAVCFWSRFLEVRKTIDEEND